MNNKVNVLNSQSLLSTSPQMKKGILINTRAIDSTSIFSPLCIKGASTLAREKPLEVNSFSAILSNKEVINTLDSIQSIQQAHVTVSNDDIGKWIDNNRMATPTILIWGTGDQTIEEVGIISSKKT